MMLIELKYLIEKYNFTPKGIIHCGAHLGEEDEYYKQFSLENVIWIEANPEIYSELTKKISGKGYKFHNCLLWNETGKSKQFNVTNNGQSSSILEMGKHKNYYPTIQTVKSMDLTTITLNDLFEQNNYKSEDYDFINLDLQGVELDVLKGFSKNISNLKYVYTEINTGEVYKNCSKVNEIDQFLGQYGFSRVETSLTNAEWGDAFYIKQS